MSSVNNVSYLDHLISEDDFEIRQRAILAQLSSAMSSIASFTVFSDITERKTSTRSGRMPGSETLKRQRRDMDKYFHGMDDRLFRRKYRMDKTSFYRLLDIIQDHLPSTGENGKFGAVPNGVISKTARLSMALRYCAGGDPLDIGDLHGVGCQEVLNSLWDVVDAIHASPELDIRFPDSHVEQTEIMEGFRSKSSVGINCCVGAIDGILIWMNKPSSRDQKVLKFGPVKFFCGRKMKYGLNMMAVCDARGRFLWIEACVSRKDRIIHWILDLTRPSISIYKIRAI